MRTATPDHAADGQDAGDRQDSPGSDVGAALATGDGGPPPDDQPGSGGMGRGAGSAARRTEPPNDVDAEADSEPDPEGFGPLSAGRGGQQFG